MPISCAINVTDDLNWINASTTETSINKAKKVRIVSTCFFSVIFLTIFPLMKSRVSDELEVRTREASVDMEAARTRMTVIPISISGRVSTMEGTIRSNIIFPASLYRAGESNSLPKPPRK